MSFKHVAWRPLPYSRGVEIGSDWQDKPADDPVFGLYRTCGFWSQAEAHLLRRWTHQIGGRWLEIGAHTGWCTYMIKHWGADHVVAVEPMFGLPEWYDRFHDNLTRHIDSAVKPHPMYGVMPWAGRSDQYFQVWDGGGGRTFDGVLIDGDHNAPHPLNDAKCSFDRLNERGVILLHDFRGPDVWDAAKYLVDRGMQWRVYPSVHMVFVAWRGGFKPPEIAPEGPNDWAEHYGLPEWAK